MLPSSKPEFVVRYGPEDSQQRFCITDLYVAPDTKIKAVEEEEGEEATSPTTSSPTSRSPTRRHTPMTVVSPFGTDPQARFVANKFHCSTCVPQEWPNENKMSDPICQGCIQCPQCGASLAPAGPTRLKPKEVSLKCSYCHYSTPTFPSADDLFKHLGQTRVANDKSYSLAETTLSLQHGIRSREHVMLSQRVADGMRAEMTPRTRKAHTSLKNINTEARPVVELDQALARATDDLIKKRAPVRGSTLEEVAAEAYEAPIAPPAALPIRDIKGMTAVRMQQGSATSLRTICSSRGIRSDKKEPRSSLTLLKTLRAAPMVEDIASSTTLYQPTTIKTLTDTTTTASSLLNKKENHMVDSWLGAGKFLPQIQVLYTHPEEVAKAANPSLRRTYFALCNPSPEATITIEEFRLLRRVKGSEVTCSARIQDVEEGSKPTELTQRAPTASIPEHVNDSRAKAIDGEGNGFVLEGHRMLFWADHAPASEEKELGWVWRTVARVKQGRLVLVVTYEIHCSLPKVAAASAASEASPKKDDLASSQSMPR